MKKFLCVSLSIILVCLTLSSCSKVEYTFDNEQEATLKVVSFNCAAPWGSYANDTSSAKRVKRFASYMNAVKPDIIGTQEMNSKWLSKLDELMPDYESYGEARGGDDNERTGEYNTVFWLKDKYTCTFTDTFWLSENITSESKYPGAGCNRICTFVILQNNETFETVIHMNTHLDNKSAAARKYGATLILLRLDMILQDYKNAKVVITGDLNDVKGSEPYNAFSELFNDCSQAYDGEPGLTYHDWGNITEGEPIDFIFTNGETADYMLLDDVSNGYVSDHYGVLAMIN